MNEMRKLMEAVKEISEHGRWVEPPSVGDQFIHYDSGNLQTVIKVGGTYVILRDEEDGQEVEESFVDQYDGLFSDAYEPVVKGESVGKIDEGYFSRMAAAIDELIVNNPNLSQDKLVAIVRSKYGQEAATYLSDKFESEADLSDWENSDPQPHMREDSGDLFVDDDLHAQIAAALAKRSPELEIGGYGPGDAEGTINVLAYGGPDGADQHLIFDPAYGDFIDNDGFNDWLEKWPGESLEEGDVIPFPTTVPYEDATRITTVDEYYQMRDNFPPHDVDFDQEPGAAYIRFKGEYEGIEEKELEENPLIGMAVKAVADKVMDEDGDGVCKDCEGEGCEWCDPDYDDLDDFGGFRGTYDDIEEDFYNKEDSIVAQVKSLLAQRKSVISRIPGAGGVVSDANVEDGTITYKDQNFGENVTFKIDGREDLNLELVGQIDHFGLVPHSNKDIDEDIASWMERLERRAPVQEAKGKVVQVPAGLRGEDSSNRLGLTSKDAENFVREIGIDDQVSHDVVDPETGELLFQTGTTKRKETKKGNYQKLNHKDFTAGAKLREPTQPAMHSGWDWEKNFEKKQDSAWELLQELRDSDFYNVVWKNAAELVGDPADLGAEGDDFGDLNYDVDVEVPVAIKRKDGKRFTEDDHDNFREIVSAVKKASTMGNFGISYAGTSNKGTVARFVPSFM